MGEFYLLRWLIPLCVGIATENFFSSWYFPLGCILLGGGFVFLYALQRHSYSKYRYKSFPAFAKGLFIISLGNLLLKIYEQKVEKPLPIGGQERMLQILQREKTQKGKERWRVEILGTGIKAMVYPKNLKNNSIPIEIGDYYEGHIVFKRIENFNSTSTDFDYATYMKSQGILYVGFALWRDTLSFVKRGEIGDYLSSPMLLGNRCRMCCVKYFNTLPLPVETKSILMGLLFGDRLSMSPEVKEQFRVFGTAHLLAVSGLHVGILWCILWGCFSFLERWKKGRIVGTLLVILLLWAYAMVTGFSPSVCRATLMCSFLTFGMLLEREYYSLHILFLTALVLLLVNPMNLLNIGFQMSFSAVLFILLSHRIEEKYGIFHRKRGKILGYIEELIFFSVFAQIGVLPIIFCSFGRVQPLFLISNILVVPLVSLVILSTIGMVLFSLLGVEGGIFFFIVDGLTSLISYFFTLCEPYFERSEISFHCSSWVAFLMYILLLGGMMFLYLRKKKDGKHRRIYKKHTLDSQNEPRA